MKEIPVETTTETLSGLDMPRVALPDTQDWGEKIEWIRSENVPGAFPFTAGVFPFKREDEPPIRMFVGEGSAERTNKRFHFLSEGQPFNRLSTASTHLHSTEETRRPGSTSSERSANQESAFQRLTRWKCSSKALICVLRTLPHRRPSMAIIGGTWLLSSTSR